MKYLVPALIVLILLLTTALGFFIFNNQKLISSLKTPAATAPQESTIAAAPQSTPLPSPSPTSTLIATQNAIKTAVAAKNYQNLTPYMQNPYVNFTLMSTDCCQPQTPQEASTQLSYIDSGVPFDFNQNSDVVKNVKAKKPALAGFYIGVSTSGEETAAFKIENNKITAIELAISYKLYDL